MPVPWESPDICSRSEKVFGFAVCIICMTYEVISGSASAPESQPVPSGSFTFSGAVELKSSMTFGSLIGTVRISIPV